MTELTAKRRARLRDHAKCRFCGCSPGAFRLHGHHILPKSIYPSFAAEVENIVTLCMLCHQWVVHAGSPADGGRIDGNWTKFVNVCDDLTKTTP